MKRPSPALGVWTPVGRPEVGAKCSLFRPPRRVAGVSRSRRGYLDAPRLAAGTPGSETFPPELLKAVPGCLQPALPIGSLAGAAGVLR